MKRIKIPDHTDALGNTFEDCVWVVPETPEDHAQLAAERAIGIAQARADNTLHKPAKKWWQFWK